MHYGYRGLKISTSLSLRFQDFQRKRGPKPVNAQGDPDRLYAKIGQLNMELDWLKKVWVQPLAQRQGWIGLDDVLTVSRQCQLLA